MRQAALSKPPNLPSPAASATPSAELLYAISSASSTSSRLLPAQHSHQPYLLNTQQRNGRNVMVMTKAVNMGEMG